ncbi:thioredoxin, mitochondrial isoform X2 [Bufo gargarizans]|uniref:thioredoxin, mitochondrial isoform X2 n=1 Tax=Bufo gargarizans TaxID=30331 RepID=UPI001CF3E7A3|nr:thioredoxin, mitochondrial isoform X2 [Bufo gargarizans]
MAQRLMLSRFISSFEKPVQAFLSFFPQRPKTHGLLSTISTTPGLTTARKIHASQSFREAFSIQNKDDFQDRVVGSETPVIVDFHAQFLAWRWVRNSHPVSPISSWLIGSISTSVPLYEKIWRVAAYSFGEGNPDSVWSVRLVAQSEI